MDNEKETTKSDTIIIDDNTRSLVEERCKYLGRDDVEKCLEDSNYRAKMYQSYSYKKTRQRKKLIAKTEPIYAESGLPIEKIDFRGHSRQFVLNRNSNVEVFAIMSEGLLFDNGKRQIPEINVSFKRFPNERESKDLPSVREMNISFNRYIRKSVNSLKEDLLGKKTEYPDSLEKAIEHLEFNFNSRLAQSFGFEIDFSIMLKTRFNDLFKRAYSGTRLMTTEAIIG